MAWNTRPSVTEFLDQMSDFCLQGNLYLFDGVLRDLTLFGRKGFNSDVDVVEHAWGEIEPFVQQQGGRKNRFGGYRISVEGVDVDIWHAPDTWACRQEIIPYEGIYSLLRTTVLNWDAVLMNWRTRNLIHEPGYFEDLGQRRMRIVLEDNPNPIGMLVRVLRHLVLKDAQYIEYDTIHYLTKRTQFHEFPEVARYERRSYGDCVITPDLYAVFRSGAVPVSSFADGYSDIGKALNDRQTSLVFPAI